MLVLLWPWRASWWPVRLWAPALGVLLYFLATPPLGLTALSLVHRRWLAAIALALLLAALAASITGLVQRDRRGTAA